MKKSEFKFGLLLGFSITINVLNLMFIIYSIIWDRNLYWVVNGCCAVIMLFIHVLWINEVLIEEK